MSPGEIADIVERLMCSMPERALAAAAAYAPPKYSSMHVNGTPNPERSTDSDA